LRSGTLAGNPGSSDSLVCFFAIVCEWYRRTIIAVKGSVRIVLKKRIRMSINCAD